MLLFNALGTATPAERASAGMAPLRSLVGALLENVAISVANETVVTVLAAVAADEQVPAQALAPSLMALLTTSDAARALESVADSVVTDAVRALLSHPLVSPLLPRIVVSSRAGEALCAALRRALLQRALDPAFMSQRWLWDGVAHLGAAAWNGEYVWPEAADETALVQALEEALSTAVDATTAPALLIYAMYRRLSTLPTFTALDAAPIDSWGDLSQHIAALVQQQVREPLDEQRRGSAIPDLVSSAGEPQHETSQRVRAQYESHPYPRWVTAPAARATTMALFARELRPQVSPADGQYLLVAGCGTGRQVAHLSASFPDADITAIDLSRSSLGYASRMLERRTMKPVRWLHGNLLELDALERQFSIISCSGVLHHLEDPRAGWRQLIARLAPRGLMKIGLYSTTARRSVRAARSLIATDGLPETDAALQSARQLLLLLPSTHPAYPVTESLDFYALSGFRDLVAHVQERSYTVDELAEELRVLDLEFLGFQLPSDVHARFVDAHGKRALRDLSAWAHFEQRHPDTFWGMYQFWCARYDDRDVTT